MFYGLVFEKLEHAALLIKLPTNQKLT